VSVRADRMFAEVDRQLAEVRATANDVAARSGLLLTASGVSAAITVARFDKLKHGPVAALMPLVVALLLGVFTLVPGLATGPSITELDDWMKGRGVPSVGKLYESKVLALRLNRARVKAMVVVFGFQALAVMTALVIGYFEVA
jgi:hypothetical protein